jgi:glutathione peroxidase
MREAKLAWIVALLALTGCTTTSTSEPGAPAPASTAPGTATPGAPKVPPKGEADVPATPAVDFTNDPNAGACTGAPGELYALSAKLLTVGTDVPLCRTKGKVLLIVNTASHCGNTPQYAPLQALYAQYQAQGFSILGFPSPQFGNQEDLDEATVSKFCTDTYKITFPLFAVGDVNGPNQHPVYTWIKAQPGGPGATGYNRDVQWNFEKFLVDRKGKVVQRIENGTSPDDAAVVAAIEAELAKP